MGEKNKNIKALIAIIALSVTDSIKAFGDGVQWSDALAFTNLEPKVMPAIQGLGMDVAELEATWNDEAAMADLLGYTVGQLGLGNEFAGKVVQASMSLALAGLHMGLVLTHKDSA